MTKLTTGKKVARETAASERGKALVAILHPRYLTMRIKGMRETYNLDYELLLAFARRREFEREQRASVPKKRSVREFRSQSAC